MTFNPELLNNSQ